MNGGLEQVKTSLVQALERAGVAALASFAPGWAKHYSSPVVAVGFRTGESRTAAMGNYLGQQVDQKTGNTCEIYGMQLELTLSLDIYAPADSGAAGCDAALETLHRVILEGLPSGLKPTELKWDETGWDQDTSMFLRKGSLSCGAYFTATTEEDGALLTDFILKGVMTK